MKFKFRQRVGLLLCSAGLVLAGCSGDSSLTPQQTASIEERGHYNESELFGANPKIATEDHTVVLDLRPTSAAAGARTVKRIPYTFKRTGSHNYCIQQNDPYFVSMSLEDAAGRKVLELGPGECKDTVIAAGTYTKVITHKTDNLPASGRLAFIGREKRQPSPLKSAAPAANAGTSGSSVTSGWLALLDQNGNLMTLSGDYPVDHGGTSQDNYFWISKPLSAVSGKVSMNDLVQLSSTTSGKYQMVSYALRNAYWRGIMGAYDFSNSTRSPLETGYAACPITAGNTYQSPLYSYSTTSGGAPDVRLFQTAEIGNYSFTLNIYDNQSYRLGTTPLIIQGDGTACLSNPSASGGTKFTVWFRYFEQGMQVPELQDGEVALFSEKDYSGKAWIFARDVPDFAAIQGLTGISSVKTGPNTTISMYVVPNDSSRGFYIGGSQADLTQTSVGTAARAFYKSPDITKFTLSSNSCSYCDLTGIQITEGKALENLSFANSTLANAVFRDSYFSGVNFSSAILTGMSYSSSLNYSSSAPAMDTVDFSNATLDNARISGVNATVKGMHAVSVKFNNVSAKNLKLSNLTCNNCDFTGAQMPGSTLNSITLNATGIAGADMSNSSFTGTTLASAGGLSAGTAKVNLQKSLFSGTGAEAYPGLFAIDFLINSPHYGANFDLRSITIMDDFTIPPNASYLNLSGSTFKKRLDMSAVKQACADITKPSTCLNLDKISFDPAQVKVSGANLQGATLTNNSYQGIDFSNVNITKGNLAGSNFYKANFTGATLDYANLDGAKMCSAQFYSQGGVPASLNGAFMRNVLLANVDLSAVKMASASFYGDLVTNSNQCQPTTSDCTSMTTSTCASATNAVLNDTSLSGAFLANVDFSGATIKATFTGANLINANFRNTKLDLYTSGTGDMKNAWLHGADFSTAGVGSFDFGNAYTNSDFSASKSCYVLQLPAANAQFAGYWGTAGVPACIQMTAARKTVIPTQYSGSVKCPDGSFTQGCPASTWKYFGAPDTNIFAISSDCSLPPVCTASGIDTNW
ncbi:MAG: pentapeptide repeat-containing protein [Syntrophales bacterium]